MQGPQSYSQEQPSSGQSQVPSPQYGPQLPQSPGQVSQVSPPSQVPLPHSTHVPPTHTVPAIQHGQSPGQLPQPSTNGSQAPSPQ